MAHNFEIEYVTSTSSVLEKDGIVVHVVNDDAAAADVQVVIYQNTGAGAAVVADSGVTSVVATWQWGMAYPVPSSGEYWVRVRAASAFLVPKVSFERLENSVWRPVDTYRPGDFAVFRVGARTRLW